MNNFPYLASETLSRLKSLNMLDLQKHHSIDDIETIFVLHEGHEKAAGFVSKVEAEQLFDIKKIKLNFSSKSIDLEMARAIEVAENSPNKTAIFIANETRSSVRGWFNSPSVCSRIARADVPVIFVDSGSIPEVTAAGRISYARFHSDKDAEQFVFFLAKSKLKLLKSMIHDADKRFNHLLSSKVVWGDRDSSVDRMRISLESLESIFHIRLERSIDRHKRAISDLTERFEEIMLFKFE